MSNKSEKCKNDTFDVDARTEKAVAICQEISKSEKYCGGLYWDLGQELNVIRAKLPRVFEKHCDGKGIDKNKRKFARALGSYSTREEATRLPLWESYDNSPHQVELKKKKERAAVVQKPKATAHRQGGRKGSPKMTGVPRNLAQGEAATDEETQPITEMHILAQGEAATNERTQPITEMHILAQGEAEPDEKTKAPPAFTKEQLEHLANFINTVGRETAIALLEWLKAEQRGKRE